VAEAINRNAGRRRGEDMRLGSVKRRAESGAGAYRDHARPPVTKEVRMRQKLGIDGGLLSEDPLGGGSGEDLQSGGAETELSEDG